MPKQKHRNLSLRISEWRGRCSSNRTVIKACISSQSHTWTHTPFLSKCTHDGRIKMLCSPYPSIVLSRVCVHACMCVCACVCWGVKIILNYTFVTWKAFCLLWARGVWLIQQSSHSNCSLYTKLPLYSVFLSTSSPISCSSPILIRLVLDSSVFLFECTDVCLPYPVATEARFPLGTVVWQHT